MDATIKDALSRGQLIDMTTTGRKTGLPRRVEIVYHVFDGRIYISGMPRPEPRAWLRNLEADPRLTIHFKRDLVADLPAIARLITDPLERHEILTKVAAVWNRDASVMEAQSLLIEVVVDGYEGDRAA